MDRTRALLWLMSWILAVRCSSAAGSSAVSGTVPVQIVRGKAPSNNTVICGRARFTLLTDSLIRMEMSSSPPPTGNASDSDFDDKPSLIFQNRKQALVSFQLKHSSTAGNFPSVTITTSRINVSYTDRHGTDAAPSFTADNLAVTFIKSRDGTFHTGAAAAAGPAAEAEAEPEVGTWRPGDADWANLGGTLSSMDCYNSPDACAASFRAKLGPGLLSREGWYVWDDTGTPAWVEEDADADGGQAQAHERAGAAVPWRWYDTSATRRDAQDLYGFFTGRDYAAALRGFAAVAGPGDLPPLSAFGVWWSRYWVYGVGQANGNGQNVPLHAQDIVADVLAGYRNHSLPLSHLVMDMDWHTWRSQFTWNGTLFGNASRFLAALHSPNGLGDKGSVDRPLKFMVNLHPGAVQAGGEAAYPRAAAFYTKAMGGKLDKPGAPLPCDLADSKLATTYFHSVINDVNVDAAAAAASSTSTSASTPTSNWTLLPDTDFYNYNLPNAPPDHTAGSAEACADYCRDQLAHLGCVAVSWNGPKSKRCNFKCSTKGQRTDVGEVAIVVRPGGVDTCASPPPPPPPPPPGTAVGTGEVDYWWTDYGGCGAPKSPRVQQGTARQQQHQGGMPASASASASGSGSGSGRKWLWEQERERREREREREQEQGQQIGSLWWSNYLYHTDPYRNGAVPTTAAAAAAAAAAVTTTTTTTTTTTHNASVGVRRTSPPAARKRGLVLSRWGGLGTHRYGVGFSGDSPQAWQTLKFEVEMTPKASNVLFHYWSHDLGGFHNGTVIKGFARGYPYAGDEDPSNATQSEMYLRWLQFGALSPVFRTHCQKEPIPQANICEPRDDARCAGCERRVWAFVHFAQMKDAMLLRQGLAPYIYTAARAAVDDPSKALVAPLYYAWPEGHEEAYATSGEQYMFGPDMVVAPVTEPSSASAAVPAVSAVEESTATTTTTAVATATTEAVAAFGAGAQPKAATKTVWLPPGVWADWYGEQQWVGPRNVTARFGLDAIPVFVRAGAVVPMHTPAVSVAGFHGSVEARTLEWNLFLPHADAGTAADAGVSGEGFAYQDDGETTAYQQPFRLDGRNATMDVGADADADVDVYADANVSANAAVVFVARYDGQWIGRRGPQEPEEEPEEGQGQAREPVLREPVLREAWINITQQGAGYAGAPRRQAHTVRVRGLRWQSPSCATVAGAGAGMDRQVGDLVHSVVVNGKAIDALPVLTFAGAGAGAESAAAIGSTVSLSTLPAAAGYRLLMDRTSQPQRFNYTNDVRSMAYGGSALHIHTGVHDFGDTVAVRVRFYAAC